LLSIFGLFGPLTLAAAPATSFAESIDHVQPKIIKIYGAGGFRGLESYQSGFLISSEGHLLTVWSYVLDTDGLRATLNDGRTFVAKVLGVDPWLEIAVLKLDVEGLPHFSLEETVSGEVGQRVLAFSNLYGVATGDEPASVQRGVISASTNLQARKGVFNTQYDGPIYVIDAMTNNPGAAGGALTTLEGKLLGMLGKELKNRQHNTWLNYALPIGAIREATAGIIAGRPQIKDEKVEISVRHPVDLAQLGVVLVPDVVDSTPPFIDDVRAGSPAAAAELARDDLILFVGEFLVQSIQDLERECRQIERGGMLQILIRRGDRLQVIQIDTQLPEQRLP
jgi:serine protease Do